VSKLSLVGGVRLNRGQFEAYVSLNSSRFYLQGGQLYDFVREHFMFLRTEEPNRNIGIRKALRTFTAKGLPTTSFEFAGITVRLYRKEVNYHVLVVELPMESMGNMALSPSQGGGDYNDDRDDGDGDDW
jgi:hypothetical protein